MGAESQLEEHLHTKVESPGDLYIYEYLPVWRGETSVVHDS